VSVLTASPGKAASTAVRLSRFVPSNRWAAVILVNVVKFDPLALTLKLTTRSVGTVALGRNGQAADHDVGI
jgi:hypothetical protein